MESYTLVLTRGTHVVERRTGETILAALDAGERVVGVDLDILCDGFTRRGVRLATSHVIALIPNEDAVEVDAIPSGANVRPFPRRSR